MKALMAQPLARIDRAERVSDWVPATHHLTDDGRNEFAARQRERMIAAQRQRVVPIKQKERKA